MVTNILTRLPVQSLLRFKCVVKQWLSTLSDQEFAKSQFKFASEHQTLRPRQLDSSTTHPRDPNPLTWIRPRRHGLEMFLLSDTSPSQ
ncbi:hypothetical protein ACFX13_043737 [Malus domestica]